MNTTTTTNAPNYWCHQCMKKIIPTTSLACPTCSSDFIERVFISDPDSPDDFYGDDDDDIFSNPEYLEIYRQLTLLSTQNQIPGNDPQNTQNQAQELHANVNNLLHQTLGFNLTDLGIHGNIADYGVGQNLEELMNLFFEQQQNKGPPPASKMVVEKLNNVSIAQEHLDRNQECSVCKEKFELASPSKCLPCEHLFHNDCIMPWLDLHNTCPVCRYELPTDDIDYEKAKELRKSTGKTTTTTTTLTTTTTTPSTTTPPPTTTTTPSTTTPPPPTTTTIITTTTTNEGDSPTTDLGESPSLPVSVVPAVPEAPTCGVGDKEEAYQ